ncbi:hypothetical protein WOLCODRAFT_78764 [Wolfiporia cocos MD-104 SS10]|uniref:lytic cellulose monooxygenase (C4-dehydrogenating) n=1 Tax=Wolfiporia cocos (strain MD-104) TaxID=742152 RepID=A0A2H3JAV7_WOLCO|nr:hypothetical protein WOLCODRAFT_78764 [Wolfiporia cocos MD-104 SS10]
MQLVLICALVSQVVAHGYVSQVTVHGTSYVGNAPDHDTVASPIRMVASNSPETNTSSLDMACGQGAVNVPLNAIAAPGDAINFTWVSGMGGNWEHEVGPVLTYMASCDNATSCTTFDASTARWFKIDQVGKKSDGEGWVQQDISEGQNFNVTIPHNLAPGGYLIRNEIIGLQNAMAKGGAEFFPSCTQLQIIGDGTAVPAPNDTVAFPGAYNATDPGIIVDVYTDPNTTYTFPGPPIATFVRMTSQQNNTPSISTSDSAAKFEPLMPIIVPVPEDKSEIPFIEMVPMQADTPERRMHSRIMRKNVH